VPALKATGWAQNSAPEGARRANAANIRRGDITRARAKVGHVFAAEMRGARLRRALAAVQANCTIPLVHPLGAIPTTVSSSPDRKGRIV
jgi:hypothetical protein